MLISTNPVSSNVQFNARFPKTITRPFCYQVKDGSWHRTTLEVDTHKPHRLPVLDVAVFDIGDSGEEFGLEFGRVCFS